jgi:hypothetical protein
VGRALSGALTRSAALVVALAACDRPSRPVPGEPSAPAPSAPLAPSPRHPVGGEASFDLALTAHGALLAWAEKHEIRARMLDRGGAPSAPPKTLARVGPAATVAEIAAASARAVLAVAWTERARDVGIARAVLGDPVLGTFGEAAPVSPATVGGVGRRGNLALSSDGERMVAFVRGEPEPCLDDRTTECTRFAFTDLAGASPAPRRVPLSVPSPCSAAIAGFVVLGGRWHYALCSTASGRELTTAFRIQYQPRYAEAHEVLPGCSPAGATTVGESVIVAADCPGGRRAVRIAGADARPAPLDLEKRSVDCELGHPVLSPLALRLSEPRDGLATLLPAEIAPSGSRAVWTGTTLIVARYVAGEVALHRFRCRGRDWARLSD